MRATFFFLLITLVRSCSPVSPDPAETLVRTDRQSYIVTDQFAATVTWVNVLDRTIVIINSGCGFPQFTLERLEDDSWIPVGGPVCIALAIPPTVLPPTHRFSTLIRMYTEGLEGGTYRIRFVIRESDGKTPLPEQYLTSNRFSINLMK